MMLAFFLVCCALTIYFLGRQVTQNQSGAGKVGYWVLMILITLPTVAFYGLLVWLLSGISD